VADAGNRGAVNFPFASSPAVSAIRTRIGNGEIDKPRRLSIEVCFATWTKAFSPPERRLGNGVDINAVQRRHSRHVG